MQNGMKQVDGECCSRVDEQTHQSSVKLAVETLMATFKKKKTEIKHQSTKAGVYFDMQECMNQKDRISSHD